MRQGQRYSRGVGAGWNHTAQANGLSLIARRQPDFREMYDAMPAAARAYRLAVKNDNLKQLPRPGHPDRKEATGPG